MPSQQKPTLEASIKNRSRKGSSLSSASDPALKSAKKGIKDSKFVQDKKELEEIPQFNFDPKANSNLPPGHQVIVDSPALKEVQPKKRKLSAPVKFSDKNEGSRDVPAHKSNSTVSEQEVADTIAQENPFVNMTDQDIKDTVTIGKSAFSN